MTLNTDNSIAANGFADQSGHEQSASTVRVPAKWWSARQFADVLSSISADAIGYGEIAFEALHEFTRDHTLSEIRWRKLNEEFKHLTGKDLDSLDRSPTIDDLVVVPAAIAEEFTDRRLFRDDVVAYAAEHGLDDPHEIADRIAREGGAQREIKRQRVRALFDSDPVRFDVGRVAPFPMHALPPVLADMAQAVADELDIDVSMCAPMALGAVSGALCGRVNVAVNDGNWIESGVAYIVIVDESGGRKSPAFKLMLSGPLRDAETRLIDRHNDVVIESVSAGLAGPVAGCESDAVDAEALSVVCDDDEEPRGAAPRLVASDVTTEALSMLLDAQGERMIVADAEGDVFEMLAGRYSDRPPVTLFLSGYSGESWSSDRAGRGSIRLDQPAITMCVATQPIVASEAVSNDRLMGKGLLARIEFAYPESMRSRYRRGVRSDEAPVSRHVKHAYDDTVIGLALGLHAENRHTARMTEAAQVRMRSVANRIKARRFDRDGDLGGNPILDQWAAKSAGRIARRALHLHMAEHGPNGWGVLIESDAVERAIAIEEWYIANAKQVLGLASTASTDRRKADIKVADAKAVLTWLIRQHDAEPYAPILVSKYTSHGPKKLRRASVRDAVFDLLIDLKYIVRTKVGDAQALYLNPTAADEGYNQAEID